MKKIYKSPDIRIVKYVSQTATNVTLLSGIQGTYKKNSAKDLKGGNVIDF